MLITFKCFLNIGSFKYYESTDGGGRSPVLAFFSDKGVRREVGAQENAYISIR